MSEEIISTEEPTGVFGRIALFYRQVVSELTKVVWPTRNQLTTYTAVVLVFVGFINSDQNYFLGIWLRRRGNYDVNRYAC